MSLNYRIPADLMSIFQRAYTADPSETEGELIRLRLRGAHTVNGSLCIDFGDLLVALKTSGIPPVVFQRKQLELTPATTALNLKTVSKARLRKKIVKKKLVNKKSKRKS